MQKFNVFILGGVAGVFLVMAAQQVFEARAIYDERLEVAKTASESSEIEVIQDLSAENILDWKNQEVDPSNETTEGVDVIIRSQASPERGEHQLKNKKPDH